MQTPHLVVIIEDPPEPVVWNARRMGDRVDLDVLGIKSRITCTPEMHDVSFGAPRST